MDNIYNDFKENLLPKIQEGLVVSKEYFTDLFGRYVKYLIVADTLLILFSIPLFIAGVIFFNKGAKVYKSNKGKNWTDHDESYMPLFVISAILIIWGTTQFIVSTGNLVKDLYIPEVRVIEVIQGYSHK